MIPVPAIVDLFDVHDSRNDLQLDCVHMKDYSYYNRGKDITSGEIIFFGINNFNEYEKEEYISDRTIHFVNNILTPGSRRFHKLHVLHK